MMRAVLVLGASSEGVGWRNGRDQEYDEVIGVLWVNRRLIDTAVAVVLFW